MYLTSLLTIFTTLTATASTIQPQTALILLSPPNETTTVSHDPILALLAQGLLERPVAGEPLTLADGSTIQWMTVTPDTHGLTSAPAGAWVAYQIDETTAGTALLTCSGHDLALVNGTPHAGVTESRGIHKLPITLQDGSNDVLIRSSGGPINLQIDPIEDENLVFISPYDATLPQIIDLKPVDEMGGIVVINASDTPLEGLQIATYCRFVPDQKMIPRKYPALPPTEWHTQAMVSVPANSARKVPFRVVGPPPMKMIGAPYPVDIQVQTQEGQLIASNTVNLATRYPTDRIRHTWVSTLDGSVQSCIIVPPNTADLPDVSRPLLVAIRPTVKSPHGTARAYHPQDDRYVCVPWSRRAGVANTPLGRADAMEAIDETNARYDIDQSRQWVSGFSDAGRAAWRLALAHPETFAAVIPVGTDLPGDAPIESAADLHVLLRWGAEDTSMPTTTAERLSKSLNGRVARLLVDVVPEQGHWWGRETVAPESLNTFLETATRSTSPVAAPPERAGFDRILERPLTMVYGTKGTLKETAALRNKARFDQERLWITANAGARVLADKDFDPTAHPCSNVVLYGNADTHALWNAYAETGNVQACRTSITIDGITQTGDDIVALNVQPSPLCDEALVGIVAPTGLTAHRMLTAVPVTEPGAQPTSQTIVSADMLNSDAKPLAIAD